MNASLDFYFKGTFYNEGKWMNHKGQTEVQEWNL